MKIYRATSFMVMDMHVMIPKSLAKQHKWLPSGELVIESLDG